MVYKCLNCTKIYGLKFAGDGRKCPYCGGYVVPIGKVLSLKQIKEMKNKREDKQK